VYTYKCNNTLTSYKNKAYVICRVMKAVKRFFGITRFRYYELADGVAPILVRATRAPLCAPRPSNEHMGQLGLFEF